MSVRKKHGPCSTSRVVSVDDGLVAEPCPGRDICGGVGGRHTECGPLKRSQF